MTFADIPSGTTVSVDANVSENADCIAFWKRTGWIERIELTMLSRSTLR